MLPSIKIESKELSAVLLGTSILLVLIGIIYHDHPRADIIVLIGIFGFVMGITSVTAIVENKIANDKSKKTDVKAPAEKMWKLFGVFFIYMVLLVASYMVAKSLSLELPFPVNFLPWIVFLLYILFGGFVTLKEAIKFITKN